MFDGQTAWFSSSVSRRKKELWVKNGGEERNVDDACFLFSQDPSSQDTINVYDSEAYLDEHLAVFHPNYINECVKVGSITHVVLGQYFFPPKEIQEIAKTQVELPWETDGNTSDGVDSLSDEDDGGMPSPTAGTSNRRPGTTPSHSRESQTDNQTKRPETRPAQGSSQTTMTATDGPTEAPSSLSQQKRVSQNLSNNSVIQYQTRARANRSKQLSPAKLSPVNKRLKGGRGIPKAPTSSQTQRNTPPSPSKQQKCDKNKQVNNKITSPSSKKGSPEKAKKLGQKSSHNRQKDGHLDEQAEYERLEDMQKITEELFDFTVGQNGCELVQML